MKRIALVALVAASCHRGPARVPVEHISVGEASLAANPALGLGADGFSKSVAAALAKSGRFAVGAAPRSGVDVLRVKAEVEYTRDARAQAEDGKGRGRPVADVGVSLELTRLPEGDASRAQRFVSEGAARHPLAGDEPDPDARGAAYLAALEAALADAAAGLVDQLDAANKSNAALASDLASSDARVRACALRVLADRRNPAALEPLLGQLRSSESEQVLRAIGALVALGDRRAVKPLIELTDRKEPAFVSQVLFAIASLGGDQAEAYLYLMESGAPEPELREAARAATEDLQRKKGAAGTATVAR